MEEYAKRPKEHLHSELAGVSPRAIKSQAQVPDWAKTGQPWVQLDAVINNVSTGPMMFNLDMTVNWINETAADMFGFRADEMVGKVWYDLLPSMESRRPIYEKVMLGEELDFLTAEVPFPDGNRYFDVHYRPIKNSDGTVLGMLTAADEVTENMRAEAALGESESRNRAFLEAIPDMMFRIDGEGTFLDFKAKVGETFVPPREFLGKRMYEVMPLDVARRSMHFIKRALQTKEIQTYEYQLPLGGQLHYYEARVVAIEQDQAFAVVRDITGRKRAVENLIRLERLQASKDLSKGISHNLNNILSTILGPADVIRDRVESPDLRLYANMISESALRAADLVKRLHWAVQDGYGEEIGQVHVNDVVQDVVHVARSDWGNAFEAKGISIDLVTDLGDAQPILGTKFGFQTILINLSLNAIDAMPDGGTIVIQTHQAESGVQVTFSDIGVGMDDEVRTRIFEPFFTTKKDVGSGLGLSTCYRIITAWGGSISVESEPGKGTTVALWFPGEPES